MNLNSEIKFQNFIMESVVADVNDRPIQNLEHIRAFYTQEEIQKPYPHFPHLTPKEAQELTESAINIDILATTLNSNFIGSRPQDISGKCPVGSLYLSGLFPA
jgi:hypothetical protein